MTRATTRQRRQPVVRPAGAWRRFFVALAALVAVFVGVPVLLVMCARVGLDASHPFPGIGSSDEIKGFFERDLTPTEIAPIAMRVLLIIGWVLWLGLVMSVLASIFEARGSALRTFVPQFAMFAGIGRWIAAGLTAITSLTPNFVSAATLASPRPFTVSSITPEQAVAVEAPVEPGFARVQRGESIETFAQRLLGDASRWPEIWELNRNQVVGPDGEVWSAAWRLGAGWDLRLPAGAVPAPPTAAPLRAQPSRVPFTASPSAWAQREQLRVVDEYEVVEGDSFWAIAERFLPAGATGHDVWEFTQALMTFNAPRLGHDHPAMLHPGDIVEIVAIEGAETPVSPAAEDADSIADGAFPTHTVVAGDSYWEIAENALGDDAAPQAVLQLTGELIDLNSPMLAYSERRMIHPGDVVYLEGAPSSTDPAPAIPPSVLTSDVDTLAIDELSHPAPPPVAVTTPVTTSTTTTTSTLPPPVDPAPPAETEGDDDGGFPTSPIGLGQAALIATGVVALLAARRRARMRAAEAPARIPLPRPEAANTERMLRRLDASERLLRIDIALRAAAAELANGDQRVVVVRCAPDGAIELLLSAPAELTAPWIGSGQRWSVGGDVLVDDLAASARAVGAPCVALTQLGVDTDEWDVLVDLEATGMLAIDADPETADAVARALAVGLASSEFAEVAHLVGVGIDEGAFLGHRHAQVVPTVDEAIELAATLIGTTTKSNRTTFSLRARHTSGEMWEPAVVIIAAANGSELTPAVTRSVASRSGLAIVMATPMEGSPWTLRPDGEAWTLDPLGIRVQPIGVDPEELDDLVEAIGLDFDDVVDADDDDALEQPVVAVDVVPDAPAGPDLSCFEPPRPANGGNGNGHHEALGAATLLYSSPVVDDAADDDDVDVEPPWSLMVKLLASPEVVDRDRRPARFERSKTLELVTWLVTHRGRSTRSAARTALWDLDVRDATFANVVSEARRVMARHVTPPDDDEWLRRTLTDELTLHPEVIADSDIVRARLDRARRVGGDAALLLLRPAVDLITDLPFAGTGYLWPDAEGITSNLVLLATSVTSEYAKLALANGDADGVFWATGRGLQVLAGQESLIALRMRAHAEAGDLSGVRLEWESYERVLTGDPWSDGEPAAKLVALRKELLSH